jgi:hypothetical protein
MALGKPLSPAVFPLDSDRIYEGDLTEEEMAAIMKLEEISFA